jgi:hypothetical protein
VLAVVAGVGVVSTGIMARKNTIKAEKEIEKLRRDLKGIDYDNFVKALELKKQKKSASEIAIELGESEDYVNDILEEDIDNTEKAKVYAKAYAPTMVIGTATLACIFGSTHINNKRLAALGAAYVLSETSFKEYKDKVKDIIGEAKEQEVEDEIVKDEMRKNPLTNNNIANNAYAGMVNEPGTSIWYDTYSGRYLITSAERIRRAELECQRILDKEGAVSINDFYGQLGVEEVDAGYSQWIRNDRHKDEMTVKISSTLNDDQVPIGIMKIVAPEPHPEEYWVPDSEWLGIG